MVPLDNLHFEFHVMSPHGFINETKMLDDSFFLPIFHLLYSSFVIIIAIHVRTIMEMTLLFFLLLPYSFFHPCVSIQHRFKMRFHSPQGAQHQKRRQW
mmetsp:Transcript_6045/g.8980  ORF Transcript_6045/g.8980 Transcript_6045/m.8980 type:complete len:98 (-) Transcript_6045:98-391(-)